MPPAKRTRKKKAPAKKRPKTEAEKKQQSKALKEYWAKVKSGEIKRKARPQSYDKLSDESKAKHKASMQAHYAKVRSGEVKRDYSKQTAALKKYHEDIKAGKRAPAKADPKNVSKGTRAAMKDYWAKVRTGEIKRKNYDPAKLPKERPDPVTPKPVREKLPRAKRTKDVAKYKKEKEAVKKQKGWMPSIYPTEFARFVLDEPELYRWQTDAIEAVVSGRPVSLCANNGSGKTSKVVAVLVLWWLHEFPKGWVVITSGSARQLEKQLMPSLRLHADKFPKWRFLNMGVVTDQGGEAVLFSTDNPGRAEGWHPKISNDVDPVLVIVDEAKTVPDIVFEAFDRCTRRAQLYVSTPGESMGQFYRTHRAEKALFWTKKVTSYDCPHIDPMKIERDKVKYGESDPLFRSMHLAEFTEDSDALILSPAELTDALTRQPEPDIDAYGAEVVGFCDFAAGGDENVFALRRGNKVRIVKAWRSTNTVQSVREFIAMFKQCALHPGQVYGDAGGLGAPMLDMFQEEGFMVKRIHNVSPAREPEHYSNLGSEAWYYARREIIAGRINISDREALDPVLYEQLTTRPRSRDAKQRLRAMPKDEMAKLGLKSPDRADAVVGAIYCGMYYTGALTSVRVKQMDYDRSDFHVPTQVF